MFEQKGESCSKMEIDFLGLNSSKRDGVLLEPEGSNKIDFADSDEGVEISLSLGTTTATTSLDSQKEIAGTPQKKSWEFPCENLIPSCSSSSSSSSSNNTLNNLAYYNRESAPLRTEQPTLVLVPSPVFLPSSTAGFPYNLTNLRNISHIPADPASLPILYSGCGNSLKDSLPKKADKTMYMATQAPTGYSSDVTKCTRGHIPTIAMARKVTLARFLEKRLHRMNQAGTKNLMGKLINATNSEVCNTSAVKCKKKKDYGTRERLQ